MIHIHTRTHSYSEHGETKMAWKSETTLRECLLFACEKRFVDSDKVSEYELVPWDKEKPHSCSLDLTLGELQIDCNSLCFFFSKINLHLRRIILSIALLLNSTSTRSTLEEFCILSALFHDEFISLVDLQAGPTQDRLPLLRSRRVAHLLLPFHTCVSEWVSV